MISNKDKKALKRLYLYLVKYSNRCEEWTVNKKMSCRDWSSYFAGHEGMTMIRRINNSTVESKEIKKELENIYKMADYRYSKKESPLFILNEMIHSVKRLGEEYDINMNTHVKNKAK